MIALPLALFAALEAPAAHAAEGGESDVEVALAQARLYARKKWYADALAELESAMQTPGGARSAEVHRVASDVAYELLDVRKARTYAARAAELTTDPDEQAALHAVVAAYDAGFGFLTVTAPYGGMATRMQLELTSMLFDPELKQYANRVALLWRDRTPLPATIGLPAGDYLVNGVAVSVPAGGEATVGLAMAQVGRRGLAALQVTRAEVSGGMGLWLGVRTEHLYPSALVQLAVTQPIGPVLVGFVGDYGAQAYSTVGSEVGHGPGTWAAGLRVGRELVTGGALAIRPSVGLLYGRVPGIDYDCTLPDQGWICRPADHGTASPTMRVYSTSTAWFPGAEISIDYREAGRTTALGTGVKLAVDQALGFVPATSVATIWGQEHKLTWSTTDNRWTATQVRMLANVSFAF